MKVLLRLQKWALAVSGAGVLLQTGSCAVDSDTANALFDQLITPQLANIVSDTVFFLLDNAFVRWTT
ncbi:MAG: hypothetical protein D6744_01385 [Planctomycetota bacterium]|nr:MAG: hypothetical protein D6744_01385 [Planctomycetota bacterium]